MPELVWFSRPSGAWHAGYNDRFEPLCGGEPALGEHWLCHEKPADCCSGCAAQWYKSNAAVGTIIEDSKVAPPRNTP